MNPYPFASLNHFRVPVAIQTPPPATKERAGEAHHAQPALAQFPAQPTTATTTAGRLEPIRRPARNTTAGSGVSARSLLIHRIRRFAGSSCPRLPALPRVPPASSLD